MITKRAILFLLFLLVMGIFWVSCNIRGYRTPTVRTNIVHPVYVLGPRNIRINGQKMGYDEKLAQNRKPPRFGPMGWFYNGSMVFRTPEDARLYMLRNFHAYPPSKTGIYWASGEFDLDTRRLDNGSYVLARTLQVEGLAETFKPYQPESKDPVAPVPVEKPVEKPGAKPVVKPAPPAPPGMGFGSVPASVPAVPPVTPPGKEGVPTPAPAIPIPISPAPATGAGMGSVAIPGSAPAPAPAP